MASEDETAISMRLVVNLFHTLRQLHLGIHSVGRASQAAHAVPH